MALWLAILLPVPGASQSPGGAGSISAGGPGGSMDRATFHVLDAPSPLDVDGELTEAAWSAATTIPLTWETDPGDNSPAPVETRCFVTYDRDHLYLGCEARDPDSEAIRAYVTDRDAIAGHDRVVFTLDPFNDARRAFRFGVSALGVQYDAVFDAQQDGGGTRGREDASWDAIWSSAGRIHDGGYTVEAAIPFKSLRFPSTEVQEWGFFATRIWPRSRRVETRSMRWDRGNGCELCQANLLVGLQEISPGRNVQLTPTLTGARTDRRPEDASPGSLREGDHRGEPGLDARWGITPNLSLSATANPDFSQVEADVAQLDVNNRFAVFFPEKRPFFLEGSDFFATPIQALFTRSIADPSFGAKLTGQSGVHAGGLMVARDQVNNLLLPGDQGSSSAGFSGSVLTTAGRIRRDVGASSAVGALYVGREGEGGYHNRVGGVDAFLRLARPLSVQLQYLRSETRYAPEMVRDRDLTPGDFSGDAAVLFLRYADREWQGSLNLQTRTGGFRADAGFVPRTNWRDVGGWISRTFWAREDAGWYTSFGVGGGAWHQETQGGRLTQEGVWTNVSYSGPLQSSLWVNPNLRRDVFQDREFELWELWFGGQIHPGGRVTLALNGMTGDGLDVTNARKGRQLRLDPSVDLRLGRRVELRLTHSLQDMDTRDGRDVFDASVTQLRAVYNFTPRAFLRGVVQHRETERNPRTHVTDVDPSDRSVLTQLLFSYKVNPRTVLFLGYSDNRRAFSELEAPAGDGGLAMDDRSFFLKVGWAWRP